MDKVTSNKITNSDLIDIYYDLFDYFGDEEVIITAIAYIGKRNNRSRGRQVIRQDLAVLNLKKYQSIFLELSNYPKSKLDSFKSTHFSDLNHILSILTIINDIDMVYTDLKDILKLNQIAELANTIKNK